MLPVVRNGVIMARPWTDFNSKLRTRLKTASYICRQVTGRVSLTLVESFVYTWGSYICASQKAFGHREVRRMSYQMFTDGLMIGFLAGVIFCMVVYRFVLQRRGRSARREIDVLVQQFQDHFRNTKRGNGEKME